MRYVLLVMLNVHKGKSSPRRVPRSVVGTVVDTRSTIQDTSDHDVHCPT